MNSQIASDCHSDSGSTTRGNDKQKIAILKKAVLELRESKSQLEKTNQFLSEQLSNLQQEKSNNEQILRKQIAELEKGGSSQAQVQQPQKQQSQGMFSANRLSSLGNLLGSRGETDNDQIQQYTQQIQQQQKQLKLMENEMKTLNLNHDAQINVLQTAYKELERDYQNKQIIEVKMTKESEEKNKLIQQLQYNIQDIERELYNRLKQQETQITQLQLKIKTFEKEIEQKEKETKELEKQLDDYRFKVAQMQSDLDESRGKFIQYKVQIKKKLINIDCMLMMRQNIYNEYVVELEMAGQKFQYNALEVTDLTVKDDKSFSMKIKSYKVRDEVFYTNQNVKIICKSIKHFLQKAQTEFQATKDLKTDQQQQGLIGSLMSFFSGQSTPNNSNISINNQSQNKEQQQEQQQLQQQNK